MPLLLAQLQDHARQLGFNLVGVAPANPSSTLEAYFAWIEQGYHAEMGYLARQDRLARRQDLNVILPEARSLIIVGVDYASLNIPDSILSDPTRGRISNYAWGLDYHDLITPRLEALAHWLKDQLTYPVQHKVYVDTGAILERSHAQQAGLGFIGKNTLLIHPKRGSHLFLGEILTTYAFEDYDDPHPATMCGACTRCLVACPTQAFPRPYVLDARRCISYLTIENKGEIPLPMRPLLGNWIYGCDVCQTVCPYVRRFTPQTEWAAFRPLNLERVAPPLAEALTWSEAEFKARFEGSPLIRLKYDRFRRNLCIAAGNSGDKHLLPALHKIAEESNSPLAASHADWAIQQLD